MGTFRISPVTSLSDRIDPWAAGPGGSWTDRTNASLITGICAPNTTGSICAAGRFSLSDPALTIGQVARVGFGFDFTTPCIELDGNPAIPYTSLPAGFLLTAATLRVKGNGNLGHTYLQQNKVSGSPELEVVYPGSGSPQFRTFPYASVTDMFTLMSNGFGIRVAFGDPNDFCYFLASEITGTYLIETFVWYLNPTTNHFQYASADPGAPWIVQDPVLAVSSVAPVNGPVAGGTALTITGTGFGDGAEVEIDGVPATSIVVSNALQITCVTPPHLAGPYQVVVINPDGDTSA